MFRVILVEVLDLFVLRREHANILALFENKSTVSHSFISVNYSGNEKNLFPYF